MQDYNRTQLHPLFVVAAIAVIVTCLVAIGVMTGLIPSPFSKGSSTRADIAEAPAPSLAPAPAPNRAMSDSNLAPRASASAPTSRTAPPRAATGSTQSTAPSQTLAGGAPPAPSICTNCGTVTGVRTIKQQGDASMLGPAAGALVGGLLGHQVGSGRGNTIATVVGAGAGAAAGTEVERRTKSTTHYVVDVRMQDGTTRHFTYGTAPDVAAGSKVRVVDGKLIHA